MKKKIRLALRTRILIVYAILIVLLGLTSVVSYQSFVHMEEESDNIVLEAIPIGLAAESLLTDLINQQAGIRGYLMTGEESFLAPYQEGKAQLVQDMAVLKAHWDEYPTLKTLIEQEGAPIIAEIQTFMESQIARVKAGQIAEARLRIGDGDAMFDAFRQVHAKVKAEINSLTELTWNDAKSSSEQSKLTIMIVGGVAFLYTLVSAFILSGSVVRPLKKMNRQLLEIAEGEGDLTQELRIDSNNEIGDLAVSFNKMTSNLRSLIRQVGENSDMVAASAAELTANAEQTSKATEYIAVTIQQVAVGSEKQVHSLEDTSSAIREMSQGIYHIANNAELVSTSSIAAAELADEGNQTIQTAIRQMEFIRQTVDSLSEAVKGLGERSGEIGQIVEVITTIAAQTNLLALNAAIEAARAGEHGRGFAVVADEVRKLAEQSSASAQQIAGLIHTIQEETRRTVDSMDQGTKEVAAGIQMVNVAGTTFEEIQRAVQGVSEQIQTVTAAAQQVSANSEMVINSNDVVATIANDTASGTQNVSAVTEQQLAAMEEIASSSSALTVMAEELQKLVGKFKV